MVKADRAIEELKVQPFSICRDGLSLIGREIYYDNQPAIINNIDEVNNLISIIPDSNYLSKFVPPPHALEDDDGEEWIETYGLGMLIRDYDEKIWWWRNTDNGVSVDPSTDPYYKQFPQVLPQPPSTTSPWVQVAPYTPSITQTPSGGLWTTIPISPYTQYNNIDDTVTWTMTDNTYTVTGGAVDALGNTYTTDIDPVTGAITESYGTADYNPIKKTPKKYTQAKAYNKTKQKGAEVI